MFLHKHYDMESLADMCSSWNFRLCNSKYLTDTDSHVSSLLTWGLAHATQTLSGGNEMTEAYERLVIARMKTYHTTRNVVELAALVFWGEPDDEYAKEREEARTHGASTLDDYMRYFATRKEPERESK
jgi:hypothetical protein